MSERVLDLQVAATRHGPMRAVSSVVAEAGRGLVGDRFHGSRHRHVSVQSADALAAAAAQLGAAVPHDRTRRNITISGPEVPTTPGARIRLGAVELEVVRVAAPCLIMEDSVGPGARVALRRRGGSICRILVGGVVAVDDPVSYGDGARAV